MKYKLLILLFSIYLTTNGQVKMTLDTVALTSINGITNELLRHISSEKGKIKNFEAIKELFIPEARFGILMDKNEYESVSLDEFLVLLHDAYYDNYKEYEIHQEIDEFNGIAQVFQTFEGIDEDQNKERGITSYQLIFKKNRWWIVNTIWTMETENAPIPKKYLKNNNP